MRREVQQNLVKAGFTDIQIMPESFLVRAKDPSGHSMMMVINPESVTAVTYGSNHTNNANGTSNSTVPGNNGNTSSTVPGNNPNRPLR